jgi:hypothetical protein
MVNTHRRGRCYPARDRGPIVEEHVMSKLAYLCFALCLCLCSCGILIQHEKVSLGKIAGEQGVDESIEAIAVRNRAGTVVIEPSAGPRIEIEAEVFVAENLVEQWSGELRFSDHLLLHEEPGVVIIEDAHLDEDDDWRLNLTIRAPGTLAVEVELAAGEVYVGLPSPGAIEVELAAGDVTISAKEVRGPLLAELAAGDLDVTITEIPPAHDIELANAAGRIYLGLPPDTAATFDLSVTAGEISIDRRFGLEPERSFTSESLEGTSGEGGPRITADVSAGEIAVR